LDTNVVTSALERVRAICRELPGVEERLSYGTPSFFVQRRMFAQFWDDHHGDGRIALWCAASALAQETLIEVEPETFFRPPYLGRRGWLGLWLDHGPDWARVTRIVGGAYATVVGH